MDDFEPYGTSHLATVGLLVVGLVALVLAGRRLRAADPSAVDRVCRVFALLCLAFVLPLQWVALQRSGFDVQRTLPFQLCDVAAFVAPYALWARQRWAVACTYFWGLTLTTQAVATPDLSADWPDPVFVLFWGMHLLIVWAAAFLTVGLGLGPTWRDYRTAVLVTLAWMALAFGFNLATDSNYGFLNAKPGSASLLDHLGPWPVYVAVEVVVVACVWALMTVPWTSSPGRHTGRGV